MVQTYVGWGAYSLRNVDVDKDAGDDYRKLFLPRTFENLNNGALKLIKQPFIDWGLSVMNKIRSSFTPQRMKMERGKSMQNAWSDVINDVETNEKNSVSWDTIYFDTDEDDGDKETMMQKVMRKFYRKIFNARCNTTCNWYKRKALNGDRVKFRGILRVKSDRGSIKGDDISDVFDDLENDMMTGEQTAAPAQIQRQLPFDVPTENSTKPKKKKKPKKTVKDLIASKLINT